MYKVCILAAGKGTRNKYVTTNKVLLPLGETNAFRYLISKFAPDIEIVVATGYESEEVKKWANLHTGVTCVDVEYEGEHRGPGWSLLQCAPHLQCPFVYMACDTIVQDMIPAPYGNWIGTAKVKEKSPYLTIKSGRNGKVQDVYDKEDPRATYIASIGLVGVHNYKEFWQGLADYTTVQGEHQDTSGIRALIPYGLKIKRFNWMDIGSTEGYERANRYFNSTLS